MQEKVASRWSRSRSRSPLDGWLQQATRRGRGAGAGGVRGCGRGGGRAGGVGLQHANCNDYLSSGQEEGITSESDADTRKWNDSEQRKKKKEEQKKIRCLSSDIKRGRLTPDGFAVVPLQLASWFLFSTRGLDS